MPISFETDLGSDAPASSATGFTLAIGDTAHGTIHVANDHDFIAVDLVAGQTYTFALVGINSARLTDTILTLRGTDGTTELATDDDGLTNYNSEITFTAVASGVHYLDVQGFGTRIGDYGVSATLGTTADYDAAMIGGIIDSTLSWSGTRGTAATLTYGFSDTDTNGYATFSQFTQGQMETTRAVLAHFAEVAGLTFTEVNPGGYTDAAVLLYGNYSAADGAGAWGGYPGNSAFASSSGDVWVNDATPPTEPAMMGSYGHFIMLHEIGHTMGLSHPGTYNAAPGVSITYETHADFVQDSNQYTVMSYFGASNTGASNLTPDTLMLYDMLALQQIYGANTTTRTEANTYGFGSNAGPAYDFDVNTDPMVTIWDAGGTDTLDTFRYAADQVISLVEGAYSNIGGFVGNLAIAYGAVIEHATGGRGADDITGNAVANTLRGGDGDDVLTGGAGNDSLRGGAGGDTLRGGLGNDLMYGEESLSPTPAPEMFDLVTTNQSAGAALTISNTTLFPSGSFTLELIWQQLSLVNQHYVMDFGNLAIYRHTTGEGSILFNGAAEDGWLWDILPGAFSDGDAHRISLTYDDFEGRMCFYLDGVLTGQRLFTPGTRGVDAVGTITLDDHAAVGDIRIFDYARSAQDIWDNAWINLPDPDAAGGPMNAWAGDGSGTLVSTLASGSDMTAVGSTGTLSVALQDQTIGNRMEGGEGNDRYFVYQSTDTVIEIADQGTDQVFAYVDYALAAGQAVEYLTAGNDSGSISLTGNSFANRLTSGAGGDDTLIGGSGNDTYYVLNTGDQVIEAAGGGNDTIYARVSHVLALGSAVEYLRSAGTMALSLIGNELTTRFVGSVEFGDTLEGGGGNDFYYVSHMGTTVIEATAGGTDTVFANTDFTLAAGSAVETIKANVGIGLTLVGNDLNNRLYSHRDGADTLSGGGGNDVYYLRHMGDQVIEAASGGTDTIFTAVDHALVAGSEVEHLRAQASVGLHLTGNELLNRLYSTNRADTLEGGGGQDYLYGGVDNAADHFVFADIADSAVGALRDNIIDFVSGRDRIDLSGIDANVIDAGDQAFAFGGSVALSFGIWFLVSGTRLILQADVTGDALADTEIDVVNTTSVTISDFIL